MKHTNYLLMVAILLACLILSGCSSSSAELDELRQQNEKLQGQIEEQTQRIAELEEEAEINLSTPTPKPTSTPKSSTSSSTSSSKSSSSSTTSGVVFTNKYGTATTKCAHTGCTNYIAPSGDTNCCTVHSNRCGQCGKYIDEDAIFCIDCLVVALGG